MRAQDTAAVRPGDAIARYITTVDDERLRAARAASREGQSAEVVTAMDAVDNLATAHAAATRRVDAAERAYVATPTAEAFTAVRDARVEVERIVLQQRHAAAVMGAALDVQVAARTRETEARLATAHARADLDALHRAIAADLVLVLRTERIRAAALARMDAARLACDAARDDVATLQRELGRTRDHAPMVLGAGWVAITVQRALHHAHRRFELPAGVAQLGATWHALWTIFRPDRDVETRDAERYAAVVETAAGPLTSEVSDGLS